MSNTPWTPGPWRISAAKPTKTRGFDILGGYSKLVASAKAPSDLYRDTAEREANARLIAAAPDMAEALRLFLEYDGSDTDDVQTMLAYADALAAAKAAYAKARGQA